MDVLSGIGLVGFLLIALLAAGAFFVTKKVKDNKRVTLKKLKVPKPITFEPSEEGDKMPLLGKTKKSYDSYFKDYSDHLKTNIDMRNDTNSLIKEVEDTIGQNFSIIKKSNQLLKQPLPDKKMLENNINAFDLIPDELYQLKKVSKTLLNPKLVLIIGLIIGILIIATLMSLVLAFGSLASGAAIASLSGFDQLAAALKWFSGGHNLYIGLILLAILIILPPLLVLYLAKSYLSKKIDNLKSHIATLKDNTDRLKDLNDVLQNDIDERKNKFEPIRKTYDEVDQFLHRRGKFSEVSRMISSALSKDNSAYSDDEMQVMNKLLDAINEVEKVFDKK